MMQIRYPNITGKTPEERQRQTEHYLRYLIDQLNWSQKNSGSTSVKETVVQQETGGSTNGKVSSLEKQITGIEKELTNINNLLEQTNHLKAKAGFIYPMATETVPDGFLLCDGSEYARVEYPELFDAIGTIYGEGDGSSTFNVPDLVTRVPVGAGENYALGDVGGEETHTLTVDEMPSHFHDNTLITGINLGWNRKYADGSTHGVDTGGSHSLYTSFSGNDQPHNNMQPYTVVNYIIATGKDTGVSVADIILGAQAIPLGVEYGGTGATNAEDARKNLGLNDTFNHIDNSDFDQFIAQAGMGGNHGTKAYAGDRWILDSGTVTGEANANGNGYSNIKLTGTIRQIIANPPSSGSVFVEMVSGTATANYQNGEVTITSNGGVIRNVLLCDGLYTETNRPKYQPKGYGAELAECILYYRKSYDGNKIKSTTGMVAIKAANANRLCTVNFDAPMRTVPTITLYSPVTGKVGCVSNFHTDEDTATVSVTATKRNFAMLLANGFNAGDTYYFNYEASADL